MSSTTTNKRTPTTPPKPLPPYKKQRKLQPTGAKTDLHKSVIKTSARATRVTEHTPRIKCAHELDASAVVFGNLRTSENGRKSLYVNYSTDKFPLLQTPWVTSYGVQSSAKFDNAGAEPRLSMQLLMDDNDPEQTTFLTLLREMDTRAVKLAVERSMELFHKKSLSEATARDTMYNACVKTNANDEPTFKVSVASYAPPDVYNDKRVRVPDDELATRVTGKMKVRAILECKPMWFMGATRKYGYKWIVKQMEYRPLVPARLSFDAYRFDHADVPTELCADEVTFSQLKTDSRGNRKVYLNRANGSTLRFQTPWLTAWDGVCDLSAKFGDTGSAPKYELQMSLRQHATNDDQSTVYHALQALDDRILDWLATHSKDVFKKTLTRETLLMANLYAPLVRTDTDYPALKAKAPKYDDGWSFAAYDADTGARMDTELDTHLSGKQTVRAILECKGLWFFGGRVGCSWHVKQLEYQPTADVGQGGGCALFRNAEDVAEDACSVEDDDEMVEDDTAEDDDDVIVEDSDVEE